MKVVRAFRMLSNNGKRINIVYWTSTIKDFTVAAKAGVNSVNYKIAFQHAPWAFSIEQCISCLFFFITVL